MAEALFLFVSLQKEGAEAAEDCKYQTLSHIGEHKPEHSQVQEHYKRSRIDSSIPGNAEIADQHLKWSEHLRIVEPHGDFIADGAPAVCFIPFQVTAIFTCMLYLSRQSVFFR